MNRLICLLIAISFSACLAEEKPEKLRGEALSRALLFGSLYETEGTDGGTWRDDGSGYYYRKPGDDNEYLLVNPKTGKEGPLLDKKTLKRLLQQYQELTGTEADQLPGEPSFDGEIMLFSASDRWFHFHMGTQKLRELKRPVIEPQPYSVGLMRNMRDSQLWNGTYSPDYNHFAFVRDYDLYMVDTNSGEEKRITEGGSLDLMSGRPDWVYPEEFGQEDAYWWSPDGSKLAYLQYDESQVKKYPIVFDQKPQADLELQSYPKAGATNPIVGLLIYDLKTGKHVTVETNSSSDVYIVKPQWLRNSSALTFQRLNRFQNHLELLAADPGTGAVRLILEEKEEHFVNLHDDFTLLEDQRRFVWSSERSGWRQLYLYDLEKGLIKELTSGEQPVDRVHLVDEKKGLVYYTAYENRGLDRFFARVSLKKGKVERLTQEPGSHRIDMDPGGQWFIDRWSSISQSPVVDLCRADGTRIRRLSQMNTTALDAQGLTPPEQVTFKAADGATDLDGILFKPADFDASKSYPMIVFVYGGPHTKMIANRWLLFGRFPAQAMAERGYVIWIMDNRGLENRGKAFETATYLQLGQADFDDHVAGIRFISERPYIDANRIGVYGGSYGGYMTCLLMLKSAGLAKAGVAHAPVSDWRNYDTIYTERYMRTPQANKEGYDKGALFQFAGDLEGHLLLTHGTVDNNVHPGQTIQLVDALIKAGKDFELMFYPTQRHGLTGPYRMHSMKKLISFFAEHLQP